MVRKDGRAGAKYEKSKGGPPEPPADPFRGTSVGSRVGESFHDVSQGDE